MTKAWKAYINKHKCLVLFRYIEHYRQCLIRFPNTSIFVKKYFATRRIFNFLLDVWKSDETLSRVLYNTWFLAITLRRIGELLLYNVKLYEPCRTMREKLNMSSFCCGNPKSTFLKSYTIFNTTYRKIFL